MRRAQRPSPRTDVVYGIQPVREALRGRREVREVLCTQAASTLPWLEGAPVRVVEERTVTELADRPDHQGLAALVEPYRYVDAMAMLARPKVLVVMLDGVTDPRNLGAIVRACDGAGADGLILPRHRTAVVTALVAKASAGAVEHLPIAIATNLAEVLRHSRRGDLWAYAADADGGRPPWELDLADGTILVLGSEGGGIRPLVGSLCDDKVAIPMRGGVASLNVAVAAGILLYEAQRQRATRA